MTGRFITPVELFWERPEPTELAAMKIALLNEGTIYVTEQLPYSPVVLGTIACSTQPIPYSVIADGLTQSGLVLPAGLKLAVACAIAEPDKRLRALGINLGEQTVVKIGSTNRMSYSLNPSSRLLFVQE